MRKLIPLVAIAIAVTGLTASSAFAQSGLVEVRNQSGDLCGVEATCPLDLEGTAHFTASTIAPPESQYVYSDSYCNVDVTAEIGADGLVDIQNWASTNQSSLPSLTCSSDNWNDCGPDSGFTAYIVPPGSDWSVWETWSDHTGYSLYFPYPCFNLWGQDHGGEVPWAMIELSSDMKAWTSDPTPYAIRQGNYLNIGVDFEAPAPSQSYTITDIQ